MISWYFDLDNEISKLLQIDAVWYQSIIKTSERDFILTYQIYFTFWIEVLDHGKEIKKFCVSQSEVCRL